MNIKKCPYKNCTKKCWQSIATNNSYPGVGKEHEDTKNLSDMAKIVQSNNNVINELRNKMIETAK